MKVLREDNWRVTYVSEEVSVDWWRGKSSFLTGNTDQIPLEINGIEKAKWREWTWVDFGNIASVTD